MLLKNIIVIALVLIQSTNASAYHFVQTLDLEKKFCPNSVMAGYVCALIVYQGTPLSTLGVM